MPACGYEFYLLVFNSASHELAQQTSEISSWTLKDKIHIHTQVCYTVEPRLTTTPLIPPPRFYSHFILARKKAQSVIFLFKEPL